MEKDGEPESVKAEASSENKADLSEALRDIMRAILRQQEEERNIMAKKEGEGSYWKRGER